MTESAPNRPKDVLLDGERNGPRDVSTRRNIGLGLVVLGFLVFLLGAQPVLFGLDRSPVIGFIQIAVFIVGLGLVCLGGYLVIESLWHTRRKTIPADIGLRFVATGYVIALASGMADVIGLGTRPLPRIPFFGYWQARGVLLGQAIIVLGFLLMLPYGRWRKRGRQNKARERSETGHTKNP